MTCSNRLRRAGKQLLRNVATIGSRQDAALANSDRCSKMLLGTFARVQRASLDQAATTLGAATAQVHIRQEQLLRASDLLEDGAFQDLVLGPQKKACRDPESTSREAPTSKTSARATKKQSCKVVVSTNQHKSNPVRSSLKKLYKSRPQADLRTE